MNIENLKSGLDIVDVIGDYIPVKGFRINCPFCDDKNKSFSINRRNQYFNCFKCDTSGDVISFVQEYEGVGFIDAVKILGGDVDSDRQQKELTHDEIEWKQHIELQRKEEEEKRSFNAKVLLEEHLHDIQYFNQSEAIKYLASRGIKDINLTSDVGYLQNCRYDKENTYPAMFCVIRSYQGNVIGGHRTYFADINPRKKILPSVNPGITGSGHIEVINNDSDVLVISEGIETIASVYAIYRKEYDYWATINSGGMKEFILPARYKRLIICADKDKNNVGQLAALELKRKYPFAEIRYPSIKIPDDKKGVDFNDMLIYTENLESK
jgi:phage/plasmid primase-like uncharacterized protein